MKKILKIYFNPDFLSARLILGGVMAGYYFVLVYILTLSCPPEHQCALCGLKTAMWETLQLHFAAAYNYNSLVVLLWIICVSMLADLIYIAHHRKFNYQ